MNTLLKDLRYGVRSLLKRPAFTAIAIATLALGIGANTAIFSLVNSVLLRALPFPDPDRLVMVWEDGSNAGFPRNSLTAGSYSDFKTQNRVFEGMAATNPRSFNLTGDGEPQKVDGNAVTADFFPVLGVKPLLGRYILPEEDQPGAGKVVMLNYRLWQQRYGGDQNIVGRQIPLNGEKHTIIGVMPAGFQFLDSKVSVWVPLALTSEELAVRNNHNLGVVARIKAGVTLAQASAEVQTIQQRISHDHPDEAGQAITYILPLRDQLAGDVRRPLQILLVAVAFVLLIACANIANLLLARAASRRREMAVRAALGASRGRIMRQLLIEGLLLSTVGAVCGLLLAAWSFNFLQRLVPDGLILSTKLGIDPKVLGFTLLLTLLTTILFALVPAFQASRVDLNEALKQGGGRSGLNAGNRLRSAMVVSEVALALVLLVGAGLLIQTFIKLRGQYSGLRAESILTMETVLPETKYGRHSQRVAFYEQVLQRVRSLPGVASAAYITTLPLSIKGGTNGFLPEGRVVDEHSSEALAYDANHRQVSTDYFQTMGIPIVRGRAFTAADNEQSIGMPVAIINETMARQFWPGEDAVGKRFTIGQPNQDPWLTIVGIAGDVRQMGVDEPVKPEMYFPYRQGMVPFYAPRELAIRTSVDPTMLAAAVRNEIHQVDPDQPISNVRTMDQLLGEETATRRLGMTLLTVFAALALLLATLGIYGVLAYFVVQHTQEIGVRMALGAQRGNILRLVLRKGMSLTLMGVGIGLVIAFVSTRLMASVLFGVTATDPLTYAGIAVLLSTVAFFACYLPARRATRVDPMTALTYE